MTQIKVGDTVRVTALGKISTSIMRDWRVGVEFPDRSFMWFRQDYARVWVYDGSWFALMPHAALCGIVPPNTELIVRDGEWVL